MKKLVMQVFKFGIVGVISFLVDYGLMIFLTEVFSVHYLISSTISFLVSVTVNYLLSMKFVFRSKENLDKKAEFLIFVMLSAVGLALNELFMWVFTEGMDVSYMISKLAATVIVMIWNFVSRKIFLEQHQEEQR